MSSLTLARMIEVPSHSRPHVEAADIVTVADYLIGSLLARAPASLCAGSLGSGAEIIWRLYQASQVEDFYIMPTFLFRSVLARIGFHYMDRQFYGGSATVVLRHNGIEFDAIFSLKNSQAEGFAIEITAKKRNEG